MSPSKDRPIRSMLERHLASERVCFHMPGHSGGNGADAWLSRHAFEADVTELPDTDDLHAPGEAIRLAMERLSHSADALTSRFLVNGSTSGIHAILGAISHRGPLLLAGRDCHQSVWAGAMLAGLCIGFIPTNGDGLPSGVRAEDVLQTIRMHPDASAVIVTSPNYYGVVPELAKIAEMVHDAGMLLIVDEAHGAHFRFHPRFPPDALSCGADLVVQSLHKTLPALTQSAVLHVSKTASGFGFHASDLERLDRYLALMQTSSPSFLLLASMEAAVQEMTESGLMRYGALLERIDRFRSALHAETEQDGGVRYPRLAGQGQNGCVRCPSLPNRRQDPTRLVLQTCGVMGSGFQLAGFLRTRGIMPEMADPTRVVLIATPWNGDDDFIRLLDALRKWRDVAPAMDSILPDEALQEAVHAPQTPGCPVLSAADMRSAIGSEREWLPIRETVDRLAADSVTPYPPGIPLLLPGERITGNTVETLVMLLSSGARIHGLEERRLAVVSRRDI